MLITEKMLRDAGACDGVDKYFKDINRKRWDADKLLEYAISKERYEDAAYGLSYLMTKKQVIEWSIYCAESCLHIFEEAYPDDHRPREAIEAAKAYLDGEIGLPQLESAAESAARSAWSAARSARSAAESAARSAESAAWSAASAAESAESAAWSAASAARAAESAIWSTARSTVWSARSTAWSVRSTARSARSARSAAYIDLLNEGLDILLEGRKVNE